MTKVEALQILEKMPEVEFQAFFNSLPDRTTMVLRAGFANWREVLPDWYIKQLTKTNKGGDRV